MKRKYVREAVSMLLAVLLLSGCAKSEIPKAVNTVQETESEVKQEAAADMEEAESVPLNMAPALIQEKEVKIKQLYMDKLLIEEAVRTLVADRLNSTSFVTVDAREQYNITEVLIDEVSGNPIVSEGVKSMLNAVSEEKTVAEIVNETAQGAATGVSDYLTGEMEGAITDALGVDIFSAIDFVNSWNNADSTPRVLLQNIVNDQKTDVAKLDMFLQQEQMNAADVLELSQLVYCIHIREGEICAVTGGECTDSDSDYTQLEQLAGQYAEVEELIRIYASVEFSETVPELTEAEKADILSEQNECALIQEEAQKLAELSIGHIGVNYDVEGFVSAQESTSQTGLLGGLFAGNVLGGLAAEDLQIVEDQVQEKRSALYNKLTDNMEESFQTAASAKVGYEGQTTVLQWISEAQGIDLYFVKSYLENTDYKTVYESAKENYVAALEKYLFDLSCAYQFYECVLTPKQYFFLQELQMEKENISDCVALYDGENTLGYTKEEKDERYQNMVLLYTDAVDYIQVRGASLGQTPGFHSGGQITQYGDGVYYSYLNEGRITLIIKLGTGEYIYSGGGRRYYFDMQGNPIYYRAGQDWVSFYENEVMAYEVMNEDFIASYQEAANKAMLVFTN